GVRSCPKSKITFWNAQQNSLENRRENVRLCSLWDGCEFKKIQQAFADGYDKYNDKAGISRRAINMRRARAALTSLGMLAAGLALSPENASAVQDFNRAKNNIKD